MCDYILVQLNYDSISDIFILYKCAYFGSYYYVREFNVAQLNICETRNVRNVRNVRNTEELTLILIFFKQE